jgi:hypothetical protein
MVHVGLHSIAKYHKNFDCEKKKIKIYFAECQRIALGKACSAVCQTGGTRQKSFFSEYQN